MDLHVALRNQRSRNSREREAKTLPKVLGLRVFHGNYSVAVASLALRPRKRRAARMPISYNTTIGTAIIVCVNGSGVGVRIAAIKNAATIQYLRTFLSVAISTTP